MMTCGESSPRSPFLRANFVACSFAFCVSEDKLGPGGHYYVILATMCIPSSACVGAEFRLFLLPSMDTYRLQAQTAVPSQVA